MPKAATEAKDLSEKDTSRTAIQHTIPVIAGITGAVTEAVFLKIATTFFIITLVDYCCLFVSFVTQMKRYG
jgi:hypothetical protein